MYALTDADMQCLRDTVDAGELQYGNNRLRRVLRLTQHGLIEPVLPHGDSSHLVTEISSTGGWREQVTYCPKQYANHQTPPVCMRLYRATAKGREAIQ